MEEDVSKRTIPVRESRPRPRAWVGWVSVLGCVVYVKSKENQNPKLYRL